MKRVNFEIILCLIFTLVFVSLPWESLWEITHGYKFIDRDNYRIGFLSSSLKLDYVSPKGFLSFFSEEILWYYSIKTLISNGIDIEYIFNTITFFCIFSFTLIVRQGGKLSHIIFLLNPLVIDLAFSQLRLAVAVSILAIAFLVNKKIIQYILLLIAPFFHSSAIVFILIFFATMIISKNRGFFRAHNKIFLSFTIISIGFLFAIFLGPLRETILSYIGDRRIDYPDMRSTWLYGSFWIVLLFFGLLQDRRFFFNNLNSWSGSILSLAFFNIIFGTYFSRFIAAAFPAIIIYMLNLSHKFRLAAICLYVPYTFAQWLFWLTII